MSKEARGGSDEAVEAVKMGRGSGKVGR